MEILAEKNMTEEIPTRNNRITVNVYFSAVLAVVRMKYNNNNYYNNYNSTSHLYV